MSYQKIILCFLTLALVERALAAINSVAILALQPPLSLLGLPEKSSTGGGLLSLINGISLCERDEAGINEEQTAHLLSALLHWHCRADPDTNRSAGLHSPSWSLVKRPH